MKKIEPSIPEKKEFKLLEKYAKVLDSSIRIPGTKKSIGLDPIMGFIPVVGDLAGYGFSVTLLYYALKHGCSTRLMMKMMGNALLDALMGMIPFVGTVFDFVYKSNDRNLKLFMEYHEKGMHKESTAPIFLGLASFGFLCLIMFAYSAYHITTHLWELFAALIGL